MSSDERSRQNRDGGVGGYGCVQEKSALCGEIGATVLGPYTGVVATEAEVFEILRQVEDPELGMDIVDLGLVYDVDVEGPKVKVTYSLTSMGCPAGPLIAQDIDSAVRQVEGVEDVEMELTFDPPWTPDKMSDDAKFILGFG
jgi:metal-sulfur cluster biosynthetic enzyme